MPEPVSTDTPIATAAKKSVVLWRKWMDCEGMFPDPEFDRFMDSMHELEVAVGNPLPQTDKP